MSAPRARKAKQNSQRKENKQAPARPRRRSRVRSAPQPRRRRMTPRRATTNVAVKTRASKPITSVPAGFSVSLVRRFSEEPIRLAKTTGKRLRGCLPVAYIWSTGEGPADEQPLWQFNYPDPSRLIDLNPLVLFPLNTPEYNNSLNFNRFKFKKLKLIYSGLVPVDTVGSVLLGYYPDGAVSSDDVDDTFQLSSPGTMSSQVWNPSTFTDVSAFLDTSDWYFTHFDPAAAAAVSWRQTFQGGITGSYFWNPLIEGTMGLLYVDYEIELVDPRNSNDLIFVPASCDKLNKPAPSAKNSRLREMRSKGLIPPKLESKARHRRRLADTDTKVFTKISGSGQSYIYQNNFLASQLDSKSLVPVEVKNEVKAEITTSVPIEANITASIPLDVDVTASVPVSAVITACIPIVVTNIEGPVEVTTPSSINANIVNNPLVCQVSNDSKNPVPVDVKTIAPSAGIVDANIYSVYDTPGGPIYVSADATPLEVKISNGALAPVPVSVLEVADGAGIMDVNVAEIKSEEVAVVSSGSLPVFVIDQPIEIIDVTAEDFEIVEYKKGENPTARPRRPPTRRRRLPPPVISGVESRSGPKDSMPAV